MRCSCRDRAQYRLHNRWCCVVQSRGRLRGGSIKLFVRRVCCVVKLFGRWIRCGFEFGIIKRHLIFSVYLVECLCGSHSDDVLDLLGSSHDYISILRCIRVDQHRLDGNKYGRGRVLDCRRHHRDPYVNALLYTNAILITVIFNH